MEELNKKIAELTVQVTKLTTDLGTAQSTIKDKDKLIDQKTSDIVLLRKQSQAEYKKLAEMSDADRASMSDKEIELQKRQEEFESKQSEFQKQQQERDQKERDYRIGEAVKKIAGNNKELSETIRKNAESIKDFDKALTPDEISGFVEKGFNMSGQPRPNPIKSAMGSSGSGDAPDEGDKNFADSQVGTELLTKLNIPMPKANPQSPVPPVNPIPLN